MVGHLTVIQPTPFCNLDCSYCYLPNRSNRSRMDIATMRAAFRFVFGAGLDFSEYTILWHAGEPLAAGLDFYTTAAELLIEEALPGQSVQQTFQTNATLIDSRWLDYFSKNSCNIGVSIDGPQFLHDRHRRSRNGRGSYERTVAGLRALLDAKVRTSIIMVLTKEALGLPEEIYAWCNEIGITSIAFNPEETEGVNLRSSLCGEDMEHAYRSFLQRFFRCAAKDGFKLHIREFFNARERILGHSPDVLLSNQQVRKWAIISIDYKGNVSSFSPELLGHRNARYGDFCFGNVNHHTLADCERSETFATVHTDIQSGVQKCTACQYFAFCGGGAPSNKFFEHSSFDIAETSSCRFMQQIPLDETLKFMEREFRAE